MIKGVIWSCDRAGDGIRQLKCVRDEYIWNGINPVREIYSRSNSFIEYYGKHGYTIWSNNYRR